MIDKQWWLTSSWDHQGSFWMQWWSYTREICHPCTPLLWFPPHGSFENRCGQELTYNRVWNPPVNFHAVLEHQVWQPWHRVGLGITEYIYIYNIMHMHDIVQPTIWILCLENIVNLLGPCKPIFTSPWHPVPTFTKDFLIEWIHYYGPYLKN